MLLSGFKAARVEAGEGRWEVDGVVAGCCCCGGVDVVGLVGGGEVDFVRAEMEVLLLCIGQPGWEESGLASRLKRGDMAYWRGGGYWAYWRVVGRNHHSRDFFIPKPTHVV